MHLKRKRKAHILKVYGAACHYCRAGLTQETATLDHFVPRKLQRGVPMNLRPACTNCNRAKGDLTFAEFRRHVFKLAVQLVIGSLRRTIW